MIVSDWIDRVRKTTEKLHCTHFTWKKVTQRTFLNIPFAFGEADFLFFTLELSEMAVYQSTKKNHYFCKFLAI